MRALGQLAASGDATGGRRGRGARTRPRQLRRRRRAASGGRRPRSARGRAADRACWSRCSTIPTPRCGPRRSMRSRPPTPPTRSRPPRRRGRRGAAHRGQGDAALRRLGDAAVPLLRAALARDGTPRRAPLVRPRAAAAAEHGVGDRRTGARRPRSRRSCSPRSTPSTRPAAATSSRRTSSTACSATPPTSRPAPSRPGPRSRDDDGPLIRALDDEIDLARRLVIAVLALRHGERIRAAVRVVDHGGGARRALGVEALDVLLSRDEAALALPLVRRDLTLDERTAALRRSAPPARGARTGSPTSPATRRASGARRGSPRARSIRPDEVLNVRSASGSATTRSASARLP